MLLRASQTNTLHMTLFVISQYEQASGACLKRDKSVLISWSKWDTTNASEINRLVGFNPD